MVSEQLEKWDLDGLRSAVQQVAATHSIRGCCDSNNNAQW